MSLEKLDENSLLNCKRYIEQSMPDIENSLSRLSNIKTPYGDVNDLIMSSRSNIRNVENKLNNLSYKLGSDIIEKINNIDVDFIPTDDLLAGYDYFKETSDTPLEDYILYVLENGSIDDILELCEQISNSSTVYLLNKKDDYERCLTKDGNYHNKVGLIGNFLYGSICNKNFTKEELENFRGTVSDEFYDIMVKLGDNYYMGLYGMAKALKKSGDNEKTLSLISKEKNKKISSEILNGINNFFNYANANLYLLFNPSIYVPKVKNKGFLFPQHELEFELEYNLVPNWYDNNVAYKETFSIKGHNVTIIQIFPGEKGEYSFFADIPTISLAERNLSDKYKLETLKKLDSIPARVFDSFDTDLTIVLPYDRDVSNYVSDTWGGYYYPAKKGVIWLDTKIKNSGNYDEWVIESALPHEIGHKFDRSYSNDYMSFFDKFLYNMYNSNGTEGLTYTSKNTVFKDYAKKYAHGINSMETIGYSGNNFENNTVEFFACAFEAYINKPDELKMFCPEVYDAIEQMIGGTF